MITLNDCLNFKHKYEVALDSGQCLVNALPREILHRILSDLWRGSEAKAVSRGWNEYFVEVLKQDLVVWDILAKVLKLPDSSDSLAVKKQEVISHLLNIEAKDFAFYEWYFELAIQSSFFENVFSLVRNCGNGFGPLIELGALDEVLADDMIRGISNEDAEKLCGRLVLRGDIEKAVKFAQKWPGEDLLLLIAKALSSIGHYSRSLELAKEFESKNKGCIYGINATWMFYIGEEEKAMTLANMTPEDSVSAKAHAWGSIAYGFIVWDKLDKACEMLEKIEALDDDSTDAMYDAVSTEISKAFYRKGNHEEAIKMAEKFHQECLRHHFLDAFSKGNMPMTCVLM